MNTPVENKVKNSIRQIPDFPKPGINFFDITTVLQDGELFHEVIKVLSNRYANQKIDAVIGIESRGFIFGAGIASNLKKPFIPIRKHGKLPFETEKASYKLEYGENIIEIHKDALKPGDKVILIDDLLATGGTAKASIDLITRLGAEVIECAFLVELSFLGGREILEPTPSVAIVKYEND